MHMILTTARCFFLTDAKTKGEFQFTINGHLRMLVSSLCNSCTRRLDYPWKGGGRI